MRMFVRRLILLLIIGTVNSSILIGGYQKNGNEEMQTEMVKLAREQLKLNTSFDSADIQILSFDSQIVSGTNYRLIFIVNEQHKCTLIAYKPLPLYNKPIKVTSFTCTDK
jgi:hypothetical protein